MFSFSNNERYGVKVGRHRMNVGSCIKMRIGGSVREGCWIGRDSKIYFGYAQLNVHYPALYKILRWSVAR